MVINCDTVYIFQAGSKLGWKITLQKIKPRDFAQFVFQRVNNIKARWKFDISEQNKQFWVKIPDDVRKSLSSTARFYL